MKSSVSGALYGALVADAFALGGHWVYEQDEIKEKFPSLEGLKDPMTEYHGDKKAGEFTHYGDQTMWLLESVSLKKAFSLHHFAERWKSYMAEYSGYVDSASKATLQNMNAGKTALEAGSSSQDLSVAGRIAPLALVYAESKKELEDAAVLQACMTHNSPEAINATRFFARLLFLVLQGNSPKHAVLMMLEEEDNEVYAQWIKVAMASVEFDTREAIKSCGQSCNVKGGCPGSLHLILKYEDDYVKAMQQNVYAGGDSAARGMVAGMILGAYQGIDAIPSSWIDALSTKERIAAYCGVLLE